jgi:cytochrome c peroxidase
MKKFIILAIAIIGIVCIRAASSDNEPVDKVELGKLLFADPILSANRTISCATCHKPAFAFADTSRVSKGVEGRKGTRNTPSAMNLLLQRNFFWDGRATTLEEQALAPIENPDEMNLPIVLAVGRLKKNARYNRYFKNIFGREPDAAALAEALAAFERSLETSDSPFDNWKFSDDSTQVSDAARRGFIVFNGKGKCVRCHFGSNFTQNEFRNIGLFNGRGLNDSGRAVVSKQKDDVGKFKTPALRNVALTAPYMHNGMLKTLRSVIDFYNDPGKVVPNAINRDTILAKPLELTTREKRDLEAFLLSLTDRKFSQRSTVD